MTDRNRELLTVHVRSTLPTGLSEAAQRLKNFYIEICWRRVEERLIRGHLAYHLLSQTTDLGGDQRGVMLRKGHQLKKCPGRRTAHSEAQH